MAVAAMAVALAVALAMALAVALPMAVALRPRVEQRRRPQSVVAGLAPVRRLPPMYPPVRPFAAAAGLPLSCLRTTSSLRVRRAVAPRAVRRTQRPS
jgi:hypothetical protein